MGWWRMVVTPIGPDPVEIYITAHTKLPDKPSADRLKKYWSDRLDALGEVLSERKSQG